MTVEIRALRLQGVIFNRRARSPLTSTYPQKPSVPHGGAVAETLGHEETPVPISSDPYCL